MRVDCSEVKTFKECKRKHLFSSRNRYHIVPKKPNDNLVFGTVWHNCLHELYLAARQDGADYAAVKLDEILERKPCEQAGVPELDRTLANMLKGYFEGPFLEDIVTYTVIDVERGFNIEAYTLTGSIAICGSIDMICINNVEGTLVGFEHKSAKNFRPDVYDALDEQPRLYYWALKDMWEHDANLQKLAPNGVGKIILNQVKKLVTKFEYKRVECIYSDAELEVFLADFINKASMIQTGSLQSEMPEPGYMKCQMCDYAPLCIKYGYSLPNNVEDVVATLDEEGNALYEVRKVDHLDEKEAQYGE